MVRKERFLSINFSLSRVSSSPPMDRSSRRRAWGTLYTGAPVTAKQHGAANYGHQSRAYVTPVFSLTPPHCGQDMSSPCRATVPTYMRGQR